MKSRQNKIVKISIYCAVVLFILRCILAWENITSGISAYELYGYAGESISVAVIITGIYERILWKYNPFEKTPKLAKCYKGTLKSSYDHIERTATLEIKQTLLTVYVTLITDESKSKSLSASIDEVLGEDQLTYCYLNTPKSEYRDRSEIHYGTAVLSVSNSKEIDGQYYTDRKTIGDMHFFAEGYLSN